MRRYLFHPVTVLRRRGTEDDEIRFCLFQTISIIGETPIPWEAEFANRFLHTCGLLVTDTGDFGLRMVRGHPHQVADMKVIEVYPGDFPNFGFHKLRTVSAEKVNETCRVCEEKYLTRPGGPRDGMTVNPGLWPRTRKIHQPPWIPQCRHFGWLVPRFILCQLLSVQVFARLDGLGLGLNNGQFAGMAILRPLDVHWRRVPFLR